MKQLICIAAVIISMVWQVSAADFSRVSVHDPSIVIGYKKEGKITGQPSTSAEKIYYIFGSHKAFAKSTDLMKWQTFTNNIQSQQNTLFSNEIQWSKLGSTNYNVDGNLWAPDVIWNRELQKWCMYMSVNGDNWYSTIVLLTSDSPEGNWSYEGPVVYSIPWKAKAADVERYTDFYKVLGLASGADLPDRYKLNRNGNQVYGLNAIDPCVFYDEEGTLWMTYGSWFGGLYMLKLDEKTGLRDYTRKYNLVGGKAEDAEEDPYMGIKIYGGNHVSGEASYIEYINDRYYLFVTYGGLTAAGGYNMRVFSSEKPTGPYLDLDGESAIYKPTMSVGNNAAPGTVNGHVGTRLMSYYKWSWMSSAFCAQGHNSVTVDDDGKIFNVYHTRFNNRGEGHEVRVHQMWQAKNGGLCTAPFEYSGETLGTKSYTEEDVVGFYSILDHGFSVDYANLKYVEEKEIELKTDGTIVSASYNGGTWSIAEGKYLTITLGNVEYQGVLVEQTVETRSERVLCITGVSAGQNADRALWGFKKFAAGENFGDPTPEGIDALLPFPESEILATYSNKDQFAKAAAQSAINTKTGLAISYYLSTPISSDWDLIAHSTQGDYKMYLGVLHYDNSDWYEAAATPASDSNYQATTQWEAFLNQQCLVTISYNPDGTIGYYRDGKLLFTYEADTAPSWSGKTTNVPTPTQAAQGVITYYKLRQLAFDHPVNHIVISKSVDYVASGIDDIFVDSPANGKTYNLSGQEVGDNYRGIVVRNGKKLLK